MATDTATGPTGTRSTRIRWAVIGVALLATVALLGVPALADGGSQPRTSWDQFQITCSAWTADGVLMSAWGSYTRVVTVQSNGDGTETVSWSAVPNSGRSGNASFWDPATGESAWADQISELWVDVAPDGSSVRISAAASSSRFGGPIGCSNVLRTSGTETYPVS